MQEITVAVLSFLGTCAGTVGGILTASRLTNYRLEQLEEKVAKHNNLVERMACAELSLKNAHRRIDEIKEEGYHG